MAKLVITGCVPDGSDSDRVIDIVYGDGFRLRMDKAVELALAGIEFWAKMPGITIAKVNVQKSLTGNYFLRTSPDAWVANNLGRICSGNNIAKLTRSASLAPGFGTVLKQPTNALAPSARLPTILG
ncbi:MAG: DUF3892 domain-containing protein [Hyphomonas oceanitis]